MFPIRRFKQKSPDKSIHAAMQLSVERMVRPYVDAISSPEPTTSAAPVSLTGPRSNIPSKTDIWEAFKGGAALAIKILAHISDLKDVPYLKLANVASALTEAYDTAIANKRDYRSLVEKIEALTKAVLEFALDDPYSEKDATLAADVQGLMHVIFDVKDSLDAEVPTGMILGTVRGDAVTRRIRALEERLSGAAEAFKIRGIVTVRERLGIISRRMDTVSDSIGAIAGGVDSITEGIGALRTGLDNLGDMFGATVQSFLANTPVDESLLSPLPAKPEIFVGRDGVLEQVVTTVLQHDHTRVAILGSAGIGKSTLVSAVLHDRRVIAQYGQRRYFIRCDRASSANLILSTLAVNMGLRRGVDMLEALATSFESDPHQQPFLLVLDNLESAWDSADPLDRKDVEDLLERLSGVENAALVVTVRGTERPLGPKWTQPFLLPLEPLDMEACRDLYLSLCSNCDRHDEGLTRLLKEAGGMPLAVRLMATVGQNESSLPRMLERWRIEKTSMLTASWAPHYSVDCSIQLSLNSPRLKADSNALDLLIICAELPDGVDIQSLPDMLPNMALCRQAAATLRQTALVYQDSAGILRLLPPVRHHVMRNRQIDHTYFSDLLRYYLRLIKETTQTGGAKQLQKLRQEFLNLEAVLLRGLQIVDDLDPILQGIITLARRGVALSELLSEATKAAEGSHISATLNICLAREQCMKYKWEEAERVAKEAVIALTESDDSASRVECKLLYGIIQAKCGNEDVIGGLESLREGFGKAQPLRFSFAFTRHLDQSLRTQEERDMAWGILEEAEVAYVRYHVDEARDCLRSRGVHIELMTNILRRLAEDVDWIDTANLTFAEVIFKGFDQIIDLRSFHTWTAKQHVEEVDELLRIGWQELEAASKRHNAIWIKEGKGYWKKLEAEVSSTISLLEHVETQSRATWTNAAELRDATVYESFFFDIWPTDTERRGSSAKSNNSLTPSTDVQLILRILTDVVDRRRYG